MRFRGAVADPGAPPPPPPNKNGSTVIFLQPILYQNALKNRAQIALESTKKP